MSEEKVEASTDPGKINPEESFFMTPNPFIQPMINKDKIEAEEALKQNKDLKSPPLKLMQSWVEQVVN